MHNKIWVPFPESIDPPCWNRSTDDHQGILRNWTGWQWHTLQTKGLDPFFPAKCKTLDTSQKFLDSASLCTNNYLRKEAGMNDTSPPPTQGICNVMECSMLQSIQNCAKCGCLYKARWSQEKILEVSRVLHLAVKTSSWDGVSFCWWEWDSSHVLQPLYRAMSVVDGTL